MQALSTTFMTPIQVTKDKTELRPHQYTRISEGDRQVEQINMVNLGPLSVPPQVAPCGPPK